MWSMILLMSRLPGGHSRSEDRKSSATEPRQSAGRHHQLPTECSDRRLGKSATRVKWPRYHGASPWTTVESNPMKGDTIHHFWRVYLTFDLLSITFDPSGRRYRPFPRPQHTFSTFLTYNQSDLTGMTTFRRLFLSSSRRLAGPSRYTGYAPGTVWVTFLFGPPVFLLTSYPLAVSSALVIFSVHPFDRFT